MAIRTAVGGEPVVLVTVDSLCIPAYIRDDVAQRLRIKKQVANNRLAICSTHSHTTPMVSNALPTLFGQPIPPDQTERIDRYTKELTNKIEKAAVAALDSMQPARLAFGIGNVGFSINRRTRGGPVDHDLPVMSIVDARWEDPWHLGQLCLPLRGALRFQSQRRLGGLRGRGDRKAYPDSVALVSVGCGADSNPQSGVTGDKGEVAEQYGNDVATESVRLANVTTRAHRWPDRMPARYDLSRTTNAARRARAWAERAKAPSADGYYAKLLAKIDAGEALPTAVAYPIQTWKFGKSLATVFLSGEVVVDYSKRLKREFDASRLWLNAYANDDPAYIPSERILKEGGYEGGGAMIYYGLPAPFAPGLEDKIISAASVNWARTSSPAKNRKVRNAVCRRAPRIHLPPCRSTPACASSSSHRSRWCRILSQSTSALMANCGSPRCAITVAKTTRSARPWVV